MGNTGKTAVCKDIWKKLMNGLEEHRKGICFIYDPRFPSAGPISWTVVFPPKLTRKLEYYFRKVDMNLELTSILENLLTQIPSRLEEKHESCVFLKRWVSTNLARFLQTHPSPEPKSNSSLPHPKLCFKQNLKVVQGPGHRLNLQPLNRLKIWTQTTCKYLQSVIGNAWTLLGRTLCHLGIAARAAKQMEIGTTWQASSCWRKVRLTDAFRACLPSLTHPLHTLNGLSEEWSPRSSCRKMMQMENHVSCLQLKLIYKTARRWCLASRVFVSDPRASSVILRQFIMPGPPGHLQWS